MSGEKPGTLLGEEFYSSGDASGGETPSSMDFLVSGMVVPTLALWCFALLHGTLVSFRFQTWVEGRIGKELMLVFYRLAFNGASGIALSMLGLVVHHVPDRGL